MYVIYIALIQLNDFVTNILIITKIISFKIITIKFNLSIQLKYGNEK